MLSFLLTKPLPSQGRDPNDNVTMELPGIDPPIPDCMVTRIAAGLYEIADDKVPWLVLFLKEESDWEMAEAGDFRARARVAELEAAS